MNRRLLVRAKRGLLTRSMSSEALTYSQYPFLAELGLKEENSGCVLFLPFAPFESLFLRDLVTSVLVASHTLALFTPLPYYVLIRCYRVYAGKWMGSGEVYTAVNPTNNKPIATIRHGTEQDYEACMDAMLEAQDEWARCVFASTLIKRIV